MALLQFTDRGIYCQKADVYLDPWKPVAKAIVTHGHSDHAYWGHKNYLCSSLALAVIKYRLNLHDNIASLDYGESININGVRFSFHPA
ncbi:MAG: DNA ligase-associated DEXH box helicase, partial [Bacteroidota bacterium]